jgi:putative membrane protein
VHAIAILGAGAVCAQAVLFVPAVARLFRPRRRADAAADRYARVLFLERELFRTRDRVGVLILVCLFERRVRVLPDRGFDDRVTTDEWRRVVARMTPVLRARRPADALQEGLETLAGLLAQKGFRSQAADGNELPDKPLERRGG